MTNNYYQKHKKYPKKKCAKDIKTFLEKKKAKCEKKPEKDIKILLEKKKKKSLSIILNVIRNFLGNKSKS